MWRQTSVHASETSGTQPEPDRLGADEAEALLDAREDEQVAARA